MVDEAAAAGNLVARLSRLSLLWNAEVKASLDRNLARVKPDALGVYMDRGKSCINDWRASAEPPIPTAKTLFLGIEDTDPEFLLRLGNLLYRAASEIAVERRKRGRQTIIHSERLDFGEP